MMEMPKLNYVPVDEQETTITFYRTDKKARIYTTDTTFMTYIDKIVGQAIDVALIFDDGLAKVYECPTKCIRVRNSKVLTSEERENLIARGKHMAAHRKNMGMVDADD